MDSNSFGECQTRKLQGDDECQPLPPAKRQRTVEDFFTFCKFILEYENYESMKQEELRQKTSSPDGSTGSTVDSLSLTDSGVGSSTLQDQKGTDIESEKYQAGSSTGKGIYKEACLVEKRVKESADEDSWDLITCFCMKPFAGRPMIECSECLTWIHLSCAKIRKSNIPDEFVCQRCRQSKASTRKSRRIGGESQNLGT